MTPATAGAGWDQVPGVARLPAGAGAALRLSTPPGQLPRLCAALAAERGRLVTMVGLDDRAAAGCFRLEYLFQRGAEHISIESEVPPDAPEFPSVTPVVPAAHWYEREVQDLLGLVPVGHPHPRRLVLHEGWPEGAHPLRKDFDAAALRMVPGGTPAFHHLHGDGIVEVPVGPIHAGVIEPGHFRFAAVGELVLHLEAQLFYTHRGMEKLAEGRSPAAALPLAERLCGVCAVSHAVSFCQAVETIAGLAVSERAAVLRTFFLELERLYNHLGDLGNLCAGTGFQVGSMQGSRLKEDLQQLNERLTGSRFLRNLCAVGGMRQDLDAAGISDAVVTLVRVRARFDRYVDLLLGTESFLERLRGTGVLTTRAARDLGAVGMAARASGVAIDARRDAPHGWYPHLEFAVAAGSQGDVDARFQVRIDEARTSFRLALELLDALPPGDLWRPLPPLPAFAAATGITESPRGENVHYVRTGPGGAIDRWRVRSASYPNWPAVAHCVPGNMVPDFPLINKSFELCYSCLDR